MLKVTFNDTPQIDVDFGDGASITVRVLPQSRIQKIARRHTRIGRDGIETIGDRAEYGKDFWDAVIAGWTGVCDEGGEPIACNRENKYRVVDRNSAVAEELARRIKEYEQAVVDKDALIEKNSGSTQPGSESSE
ncbi:MAG: hypothetical protein AB7W37_06620 [Syntrophobacteraceae bacterium]